MLVALLKLWVPALQFLVGNEVYGSPKFGGYAEYVAVAVDDVALKPQTLDFIQQQQCPLRRQVLGRGERAEELIH